MSKKVVIPTKPVRDPAKLDQWISGAGESPSPAAPAQPAAVAVTVAQPPVAAAPAPVVEIPAVTAPEQVIEPETPPAPAEPMKRLTIDITESLHRRIKATCAQRGTKMVDEIRILLESAFP